MARRVAHAALAAALAVASSAGAAEPARGATLVAYSFDDDVATGPDTFSVFRGGKGHVRLSDAFHVSGYRSVELQDVAGDGDFPELQGYFPVRRHGRLYFHFAVLFTAVQQELNLALAGPKSFNMGKDGLAFWLAMRDGRLVHYSDSIPKKLFVPDPFVWYTVDVAYDVDKGVYDLAIQREGRDAPQVSLQAQPNVTSAPGSAVDKFSFVGSPWADTSNVVYFVDDVVLSSDQPFERGSLAAPGRRKLFVDAFVDHQRRLLRRPGCLPAGDPEDFGLGGTEMRGFLRDGALPAFERLATGDQPDSEQLAAMSGARWTALLQPMSAWNQGCLALARGDSDKALERFDAAAGAVPGGRVYQLSAALALVRLKRFPEADERLLLLAAAMRDDPRYAAALGYAGIARGDLERAERALRDDANRVAERPANPLLALFSEGGFSIERLRELRRLLTAPAARAHVEETIIPEQYYYTLLWQARHGDARDYALRMSVRMRDAHLTPTLWVERMGDACLFDRRLREARELYEEARTLEPQRPLLDLKLSDVAFLAGDLEAERALRERYYGALRE